MTPLELRDRIYTLPPHLPLERALAKDLERDWSPSKRPAWYSSQKQHWLGWLRGYDGPGAYGRSDAAPREARYIWARIQCPPMLFWLAEAVKIPEADLREAYDRTVAAPPRESNQCGALRSVITWPMVESRLPAPPSLFEKLSWQLRQNRGT